MRIPTSTIVMSLVTCIPFGLAIRDTLRDPAPHDEIGLALPDDDSSAELEHQMEADRAREAREEAEQRATADRVRGSLLGATPASLGEAFRGLQIGSDDNGRFEADIVRQLADASFEVGLDDSGGKLAAVHITGLDNCDQLRAQLETKWGATDEDRWLDAASGRRASLTGCTLDVDRFVDATAWVKALPLKLIGTSADKARDALGDKLGDQDDAGFSWRDLGPGPGGSGMTTYDAFTKDGKIASLSITSNVAAATGEQIRVQLAKQYGQPKTDPDTGVSAYRSHPAIQLEGASGQITLSVGTLP